jgi:hypothetical protein
METRKPFKTIRLHDPAIDWNAVKHPPIVERECAACGGLRSDDLARIRKAIEDGLEARDLSKAFCDACGGEGVLHVPEYEPYDEGKFCTERDLEKVLRHTFPGAKPVVFTYRRLTTPQRQKWVSLATSYEDRCVRAFQAGVIAIEFPDAPKYVPRWLSKGALTMDDKELREVEEEHGIEWPDLLDIGSQVLARSDVPLDCTPSFPVLPSSVDAWVAVQRRCAERRAIAAPPSSDARKAP